MVIDEKETLRLTINNLTSAENLYIGGILTGNIFKHTCERCIPRLPGNGQLLQDPGYKERNLVIKMCVLLVLGKEEYFGDA
jgi:hypothetical protein